jgi:hypothetical protein
MERRQGRWPIPATFHEGEHPPKNVIAEHFRCRMLNIQLLPHLTSPPSRREKLSGYMLDPMAICINRDFFKPRFQATIPAFRKLHQRKEPLHAINCFLARQAFGPRKLLALIWPNVIELAVSSPSDAIVRFCRIASRPAIGLGHMGNDSSITPNQPFRRSPGQPASRHFGNVPPLVGWNRIETVCDIFERGEPVHMNIPPSHPL